MALCAGLICTANATPIEIPGTGQDIPKNGTGPVGGLNGNSPADDFFRLESVVNAYNLLNPGAPLPTPVFAGDLPGSSSANDQFGSGGLSGFEYAVLHYGAGSGGTSGGGVEVFLLNGASQFTFPGTGSGSNGKGGFSSVVLFKAASVPDGGLTVLMLGGALSGLGLVRRKLSGN